MMFEMFSDVILKISFIILVKSTFSHTYSQENSEEGTLTIPGTNCLPSTTNHEVLLSYSFLEDKCENVFNHRKIKIEGHFSGLEVNLFKKLTNIESLQANFLEFATIFLKTFNLKNIDLSKNAIRTVEIVVSKNLQNLDLSHNEVVNLKLTTKNGENSNLENLNISHNNIRKLKAIPNFENLKYLDMSWNRIEHLPEHTFSKLIGLTLLNLSFNKLSSLTNCVFCDLQKLQKLDLSHNIITKIHGFLTSPLKSLKYLDLDGNKFENFSYSWMFEKYESLEELRIENKIFDCTNETKLKKPCPNRICFFDSNSTKTCCSTKKKHMKRRSLTNSHFHAIINNKKMWHNTTANPKDTDYTKTKEDRAREMKEFFGKLHNLNAETVKNFLNLTLKKIDLSISELKENYSKVANELDSNMILINKKLDEMNETFSDIYLEISNLNTDNVTPNTVNASISCIEEQYEDILYLLRICFFLLVISVFIAIFRIISRMRRKKSKMYQMNLLNMEMLEHH